ncbi:hypothetical protein PEA_00120 [Erwinia phage phiEa1H]|uniref:Uncharacterized protein n=2 Tax=Eracentumvirus era103 TaxID=1985737 RepID=E5AGH4_9CAUD|nr:hypothetical protein Era103g13 [Erwinia phage Era103]YP_007237536.1 hypothetical protein G172_gp13 [Erwinia phage phiEa100]ABM63403.1 hypothetical protein Era103g13 [Erwinia phage Era103]CBX44473.1 hypothetical protein PEA_00120 [Erwinia phage phiEa1H]CBX45076.1 hypothetical protein P100_00130 [Erwinia phage phiEa100]
MNKQQSLRVLDNIEFAQEKVSSDASLFAQFAMAEARRNRLTTSEMMNELETKGEKKIILL